VLRSVPQPYNYSRWCLEGNEMKAYLMERWARGVQHAESYERPTIVALDFHSQVNFTAKLVEMCSTRDCRVHVSNKNSSCDAYEGMDVTCDMVKENRGRDAASALEYVISHYDELPPTVYFVPTSEKWNRLARVQFLVDASPAPFDCLRSEARRRVGFEGGRILTFKRCLLAHGLASAAELGFGPGGELREYWKAGMPRWYAHSEWSLALLVGNWSKVRLEHARESCRLPGEMPDYWPLTDLEEWRHILDEQGVSCDHELAEKGIGRPQGLELLGDCANFTVDAWQGVALPHATPRPLDAWYDARVHNFSADSRDNTCVNLVFKTTRELLRQRSKESYQSILDDVIVGESTEGIHYVERSVPGIFGASHRDPPGPS